MTPAPAAARPVSTTTTKPKAPKPDKAGKDKAKDTPPPVETPPAEPPAVVDTPPALWIPPASETAGANQAPIANEGAVNERREGGFPYEVVLILFVVLVALAVVFGAVRRYWRDRGSYFAA